MDKAYTKTHVPGNRKAYNPLRRQTLITRRTWKLGLRMPTISGRTVLEKNNWDILDHSDLEEFTAPATCHPDLPSVGSVLIF